MNPIQLLKSAQILYAVIIATVTTSLAFAFGPAWLGFIFLGLATVTIGGLVYAQYRLTKFFEQVPSALNEFNEQMNQPGGPLDKLAEQMNQHGGSLDELAKTK